MVLPASAVPVRVGSATFVTSSPCTLLSLWGVSSRLIGASGARVQDDGKNGGCHGRITRGSRGDGGQTVGALG